MSVYYLFPEEASPALSSCLLGFLALIRPSLDWTYSSSSMFRSFETGHVLDHQGQCWRHVVGKSWQSLDVKDGNIHITKTSNNILYQHHYNVKRKGINIRVPFTEQTTPASSE